MVIRIIMTGLVIARIKVGSTLANKDTLPYGGPSTLRWGVSNLSRNPAIRNPAIQGMGFLVVVLEYDSCKKWVAVMIVHLIPLRIF